MSQGRDNFQFENIDRACQLIRSKQWAGSLPTAHVTRNKLIRLGFLNITNLNFSLKDV